MMRVSGWALVALGLLHMVVLGLDAVHFVPDWLRLSLWTNEHMKAFGEQPHAVLASNAAFWATLGSFALPGILIGLIAVDLDRRGIALPSFVGWALLAVFVLGSLVMQPSGFPLGIPIAIAMIVASRRRAGQRGDGARHPL